LVRVVTGPLTDDLAKLAVRRITAGRGLAREAATRPCHFVAFDLLRDEHGTELLGQPLRVRRRRLEHLLADAPPQLPICPQTDDDRVARSWITE
jgi:ATP-dependent DNA ligase